MSFGLELVNFYRGISPSLVFRCHWDRAAIESRILPRLKAPLFAARLKLCREKRRAATWGRPYGNSISHPFFRRGRTLASPSRGFCHSEAHPHPPRMRSAPSPLQGEGLRAAKGRPFEIRETLRPFRRGRRPRRPAGAHCAPLQRETRWERWFGKPRRGSETAPAAILEQPGPSGPVGI